MTARQRNANESALGSSTRSALSVPPLASFCQRLRDDPVSLVPGTSQLPAFRLIYRLPQLHADNGFAVAARVFATWIFGDITTQLHPYTLPPSAADEGFGSPFGYRAYRVPWSSVADSTTLRTTLLGISGSLERLIAAQIRRRLHNDEPPGPREIDRYAARAWSDLRKRFLAARDAGRGVAIATGWLPLPSTGLQFYSDVLIGGLGTDDEVKPTEAAMVFGGANLYPLVQGTIERPDGTNAWTVKISRWKPVLVDRFGFEDDHRASQHFTYSLVMTALRSRPGVLEYPSSASSQPLGLWDPNGHIRLKGTPERPVIELLNRSFTDFAREIAEPVRALRQRTQCTLVSSMLCEHFELIGMGGDEHVTDLRFRVQR